MRNDEWFILSLIVVVAVGEQVALGAEPGEQVGQVCDQLELEADQLRGHVPGAKGGVEGPTSDRPPGGVAQPCQPEQLRDRGARQVDLVVPGLIN